MFVDAISPRSRCRQLQKGSQHQAFPKLISETPKMIRVSPAIFAIVNGSLKNILAHKIAHI